MVGDRSAVGVGDVTRGPGGDSPRLLVNVISDDDRLLALLAATIDVLGPVEAISLALRVVLTQRVVPAGSTNHSPPEAATCVSNPEATSALDTRGEERPEH